MARQNLDAELDELYNFLFPPGKKSGSGSDPLRKLLAKQMHIFSMHVEDLTNQLMLQGKRDSENKQRDAYLDSSDPAQKAKNREMVKAFVVDLVDEMYKQCLAHKRVNVESKNYVKGLRLKVTVDEGEKGEAPAFDILSKLRTAAGEIVEPNHQALFKAIKKEGKSTGSIVQIGHTVGVAAAKGAAVLNSLEGQAAGNSPILAGGIDVTKDAIDQVKAFLVKYDIDIQHYRDVKVKSGKLEKSLQVGSSAEGADYNGILKANKDAGTGISEKKIGEAIKQLIENIRERTNEFYSKMGPEEFAASKTSQSFLEDFTGVILAGSKTKRIRRNKKLTKADTIKQKKDPKSFSDKSKQKTTEFDIKTKETKNYAPLRSKKASANRGRGGTAQVSGNLLALLNEKLPEHVAKNMGLPGLQNQTGRFASSVRATDVVQTAKGFPSIGYTYQKNPYQVFEMGTGDSRWATNDRDPRKLIDRSVREIAAQFVVGRLYTRRV